MNYDAYISNVDPVLLKKQIETLTTLIEVANQFPRNFGRLQAIQNASGYLQGIRSLLEAISDDIQRGINDENRVRESRGYSKLPGKISEG